MNELNRAVIINKGNSRAVPAYFFSSKDMYKAYTTTVNALRKSLDRLMTLEDAGVNKNELAYTERLSDCYACLRSCYKWYANAEDSFKLKPSETDLEALRAIARKEVKTEGVDGKVPEAKSLIAFRNSFENFVARRIVGEYGKSAEQIDAEKKAKADARRAKRQAKAAAKRALENKVA